MGNANDIVKVNEFEKQFTFLEFRHKMKASNVLKRLQCFRDMDYGMSPEDILIEKDERERMVYAVLKIKQRIGIRGVQILVMKNAFKIKLKDVAKTLGISYDYAVLLHRTNKRIAKDMLREMILEEILDEDMFKSPRGVYYAKTPKTKVNYPFDSAKETFKRYYKRSKELRVATECKAVEYLDECFSDNKTICNVCGKQCTRKDMGERIEDCRNIIKPK